MYLKTLTIRGFKSFASATTFEFEPGVTAVVGPNGSGKSNVVDALAWVMGEQGAKNLRGGKMEDVIFAGTSGRAALGRAQVSLTIDNADGALPIEYSEVTISRTLFRSGGSEYAINGQSCRLLDIQELLSDSGLGREMHVIVGQGQLDRILQATPEQRRGFIEEASGILKHRRRKDRSVRKLESMRANLDRVRDLTEEVRRQLGPLSRQAETARKAQRIQFDVRDARARLLADEIVAQDQAVQAVTEDDDEVQQRLKDATATQERAEVEAGRLARQAETSSAAAGAAREHWYELSNLAERYRSLKALAEERLSSAATPVPLPPGPDPKTAQSQVDHSVTTSNDAQQSMSAAQQDLTAASEQRETAERTARIASDTYTQLLQQAADRRQAIAVADGAVNTAQAHVDSLRHQLEGVEAEAGELSDQLTSLQHRLEKAKSQEAGDGQDGTALEEQHTEAQSAVAELREHLATHERAVSDARSELSAAKARVEVLESTVRPATGSATEQLKNDGAVELVPWISVEPGWERAVSVALGDPIEQLYVPRRRDALDSAHALTEADGGEARVFFGNGGTTSRHEAAPPAGAVPTAELLRFSDLAPEGMKQAVLFALTDVCFVSDLTTADHVADQLAGSEHRFRAIVTREGHTIRPGVVEARGHSVSSILEQRADTEEAREQVVKLQALVDEHQGQAQRAREELDHAIVEELTARQRLHEARTARAASAERQSSLQRQAHQAEQAQQRNVDQRRDLQGKVDEAAEKLTRAEERREAAHAAMATAQGQEDSGHETINNEPNPAEKDAAESAAVQARTEETEARLALRSAESMAQQADQRLEQARRRASAAELAQQERQQAESRRKRIVERLTALSVAVEQSVQRIDSSVDRAESDRQHLETQRTELEQHRIAALEAAEQARCNLGQIKDALHARQMAQQEQQLKLEQLQQRSHDELGYTHQYLVEHFGPEQPVLLAPSTDSKDRIEGGGEERHIERTRPYDRDEQTKRLRRAQRELSALGKVNPLALEEYAAVEERHQYLSEQLEDLESSRKDLLQIIDDVDSTVLRVFKSAYEDTAEQFQHVFATLFPGGEGRLSLTEPDNLLETGIEVEARPAGKKVKRLSLLSGGERSLAAVAMLVSIFKARPSPFYVMDEVEAALDDTNLSRLLTTFRELKQDSQLIIITHQKRTMEVADALYGTSMRGDGVTKVISQRLDSMANTAPVSTE